MAAATTHLVATCADVIKTWELGREPTLEPRQDVPLPGRAAAAGPWHCVRWNHNNQVIAAAGEGGAVALLHESGKLLEVLSEAEAGSGSSSGPPTRIESLAWGGRSRFLVTTGGADRRPTLWDLKKKAKARAFRGHQCSVTAVAFSPDDAGVASGNNHGEILLHQLKSEEPALTLPFHAQSPGPNLMSPSSISASVKVVNYWAMRQPLLLAGYRNGDARVWDAAAGACVASFKGQHQAAVTCAAGSTVNNKLMATAGLDRRVLLFDVNQRKLLRECKAPAPVHDMAFAPEGDVVLVGCQDGTVAVFDLRKPAIPCLAVAAHPGHCVRSVAVQNPRAAAAASSSSSSSSAIKAAAATTTSAAPSSGGAAAAAGTTTTPVRGAAATAKAAPAAAAALPESSAPATVSSSSSSSTGPPSTEQQGGRLSRPAATAPSSSSSAASLPSVGGASSSGLCATSGLALSPPLASTTATTTTTNRLVSSIPATTSASSASTNAAGAAPAPPSSLVGKQEEKALSSSDEGFTWRDDARTSTSTNRSSGSSIKVAMPPAPIAAAAGAAPTMPTAAAGVGGGAAAVPAPAAAAGAAKAVGQEMAALVEEKVRDMVEDLRDEFTRDMKGLHLELLRTSEGAQAALEQMAQAFAALVEENRALRREVDEMRQFGY